MNKTLLKGLQVIELLAHSDQPMTLTEIAAALDLVKSNVHRLLQSLMDAKYVIRDDSGLRYSASIRLWELGSAVLHKLDLRRHAEYLMDALMMETDETVHLSALDGNEVVYVHKVESLNPVRAYTQIGGRIPANCVATGKAMLAYQSAEHIQRIANNLEAYTASSITSPKRFLQEIAKIRRQGYAVNQGEWRDGVYGVAAPIFASTGHAIAAIGVSGPEQRFKQKKIRHFAELLMSAAQEIASNLRGGTSDQALHNVGRKQPGPELARR